jgi:cytochrome P450
MSKTHRHVPPGPRGLPLLGVALDVRRDPLTLLSRLAKDYGDIVNIPLPFRNRILLSHPDDIERVLVIEQHKFQKSAQLKAATRRLLGNGLLTSDGALWRRQRRLIQPAFHRAQIASYAPVVVDRARAHMEGWRDGDVRDIAEEMMRLTIGIAVQTLFGIEMKSETIGVGQALGIVSRHEMDRLRQPIRLPRIWSTPEQRRVEEAYEYLDSLVYRIIAERRARREQGSDLLSMLIRATDEDGSQMTPKQLRDETMTLFLAGHETTALALAWTWYLLGENARTELCLHEELARVLGGRAPMLEDIERLPYLTALIRESLRLYPPAYIVTRTALEPFVVGRYWIPAGTTILLSQWVVHRDERFFPEPLVFRPERWLEGQAGQLPNYAYFPFGGGPRRCIGQGFAEMEAALALATIAQRYRFRIVPEQRIVPEPLVTLRPKYGIRVTVLAR